MLKPIYTKYLTYPHSVEAATDINRQTTLGETALHYAAAQGKYDIIELLCQRGTLVNCANFKDVPNSSKFLYTPLHFAAEKGHVDAVKMLVTHNADISLRKRRRP